MQDHIPLGDPCYKCGFPAIAHRVEHASQGNPCSICGLRAINHRIRKRKRKSIYRPRELVYWGIDGEGVGRKPHRYNLLAACSERGNRESIEAHTLSTVQCLEFILSLPDSARLFSFSFLYDLAKILKDVDNQSLYLLVHENLRRRKNPKLGPKPIMWKGYRINLQRRKFTVQRGREQKTIWDIFAFFQSKFTKALSDWKICDEQEIEAIERMKELRGEFESVSPEEVKEYCFSECFNLAILARKLIETHEMVGLPLRSYHGAGSTATALLNRMSIKDKRVKESEEMAPAVASAFFGGRFENSVIGAIPGPVYQYDIASAYPFQLTQLPCLLHGEWVRTADYNRAMRAKAALIQYRLESNSREAWGPFPFRDAKGTICFPYTGNSGWIWREEYLAGAALFDGVQFRKAWVLESDCNCQPFDLIEEVYQDRLKLGKEAKGIVLKLGMNSCYGKLAQSLGVKPPFQSWIWAGMITSGCRAQILKAMAKLDRLESLLMIATDAIYTTERLFPESNSKALGTWEEKVLEKGVFAARPGIYFPLDPPAEPTEDEIKSIRARGLGKRILFDSWKLIKEGFESGLESVTIASVPRFRGIKSSISIRKGQFVRSPEFGEWESREIALSFNPMPKRLRVADDGRSLIVRAVTGESEPYKKALADYSPEAILLKLLELEAEEQPDGEI